ncbi:MAG: tRNA lysidine(34) synthetase TilS, partial [Chitinophagaceae bacterium]|nr:tRNA lysidine(34) synthetase TilS [Chitinophagaceae bacterium]
MKDLTNRFAEFVRKKQLFYPEDLLIIAVSGGVDSVVLFNLCKQSGFRCVIAHCNFQLRGGESLRDEAFVKELAESHEVELFLKRFDTGLYAIQNQVSVQMAARELRYQWFEELRSMLSEERGVATYILTAHHGDDNVETVLMNFFKGTGISGMHGILPKAGKLVRPLLFASKKDIERHAVENNLFFVEDSSNAEDNYSRNYIRHQIIPRLTVSYPGFYDNMMKNIDRFTQVELLYNQAVGFHKKKLLEERNNEVYIPVNKLRNT